MFEYYKIIDRFTNTRKYNPKHHNTIYNLFYNQLCCQISQQITLNIRLLYTVYLYKSAIQNIDSAVLHRNINLIICSVWCHMMLYIIEHILIYLSGAISGGRDL